MEATGAKRIYSDVVAKVSRALNKPFSQENAVRPRENIMRRRDSMCIMISHKHLQAEFPDDDIDPRFMFDHPTIESMAHSLCGCYDCPYCSTEYAQESAQTVQSSQIGASPDALPHIRAVAFTQLMDPCPSSDFASYEVLYRTVSSGHFARTADGMECVLVPAATAWIGADMQARAGCRSLACERPCHEVRLSAFLMDIEPVCIGSYARFLNVVRPTEDQLLDWCVLMEGDERTSSMPLYLNDGSWTPKPEVSPRWPMILVSWFGANAYSLWANGHDWKNYRDSCQSFLPSEAQWEYAARGRSVKNFPWGDDDATPALLQVNWKGMVQNDIALKDFSLVDVNVELGVSAFGLRHMAGNVWHWCRDTFDFNFYANSDSCKPNAWNCADGDLKSERGGSWVGPACLARSSYRRGRTADAKGRCLGFRCIGDPSMVLHSCSDGSSDSSTRSPGSHEINLSAEEAWV